MQSLGAIELAVKALPLLIEVAECNCGLFSVVKNWFTVSSCEEDGLKGKVKTGPDWPELSRTRWDE